MPDTFHDDDPTNVKVNRPLEQDWGDPRPYTLDELEEKEPMETARQTWESDPVEEVAHLRPRKTPTERKSEALEHAWQLAKHSLLNLELSLDELSIDSESISQEEYEAVVPVLAAYLDRVERRHRARTQ